MKTVCRVFAYLKRYPLLAIATLACAIAGTLMVIVPPAATKYVLNSVINGPHSERLLPLLILVAFAMLLQRGLDYLRLLLNNTFEQKVIFDLRRDLYSHIQTLPLRWFDNRATGDLMTRILEDVSSVERVLIDGIEKGTVAVLQIVVVVVGMFYLSTKLALVALAPVPFLAGGALWYTLTAHRRYRLLSACCWWWPWGRTVFYPALSSWAILALFFCWRVFSTSQWGNCMNSINWCRQGGPRANASSKFSIQWASRRVAKRLLRQCAARLSSGMSVSAIPASCRR